MELSKYSRVMLRRPQMILSENGVISGVVWMKVEYGMKDVVLFQVSYIDAYNL